MSRNWLILGGLAEVDVCIFYRFCDIFYDFELILWRYSGENMQKCAFLPRAQRAERKFSPVGPNVMSCRDKWLDFETDFSHLSLSRRDKWLGSGAKR